MAHDLKTTRFLAGITQWDLATDTGINQANISHAERGKLILNSEEKDEISFVLGKIDWERTENQDNKCDFAMPKVDYSQSKRQGYKIRRLKNAGLEKPELIWAGEKEDHEKYTYEPVKDGR